MAEANGMCERMSALQHVGDMRGLMNGALNGPVRGIMKKSIVESTSLNLNDQILPNIQLDSLGQYELDMYYQQQLYQQYSSTANAKMVKSQTTPNLRPKMRSDL